MDAILKNSTPFDIAKQDIDDLFNEAKTWLDGAAVETQEQADMIALLLDQIRKAKKAADEARKDEKRPHDEAAKAVQERYAPVLKRANLIADACKAAMGPFLEAQERQKREAERVAREEAEAATRAAQEAMARTSVADIEDREEAERLAEAAKAADVNARKLAKDKGHAKGGARAVGLRTRFEPELTDLPKAIQHFWDQDTAPFSELARDLARKAIDRGQRKIPGFNIKEVKTAV